MASEADIPADLQEQRFDPTGGIWKLNKSGIIELTLGPNVEDPHVASAEAHWVQELFERLKALRPDRDWGAIVSLEKLPPNYKPALEMRAVFTQIMQDPRTARVAMTNYSAWQRMITQTYMLTSRSRHKVKFCRNRAEAESWVARHQS